MAVNEGFETAGLDGLSKDLLALAEQQFPKETKSFLRKQAAQGRTRARRHIRAATKKKTGNLLKGVTAGKVWKNGEVYQVRVYNKAPHAHLIENGHVLVAHGTKTERFVPGKHVMAKAGAELDAQLDAALGEFVDDLLKKGLG